MVTMHIALLPLATLAILHWRGQSRDAGYWWVAVAFAVSYLADAAALLFGPDAVSVAYPVAQAAILGAILLCHRSVHSFVRLMAGVAILVLMCTTPNSFTLRAVAFGVITAAAYTRRDLGDLSIALVVYFGLGLLSWMVFTAFQPLQLWQLWMQYQGIRLLGILLTCVAFRHLTKAMRFNL